MKYAALLASAFIATSVLAEPRFDTAQFKAVNTNNAVAAVTLQSFDGTARGSLLRVDVTVDGTSKTNTVIVSDSTGTVLLSNQFTSGTTKTWFTNNPVPFIGVSITQFGPTPTNSAALPTNTVSILYNR